MFDNVANGCADSQRLNPKQTGDLQLSMEFGAAPKARSTEHGARSTEHGARSSLLRARVMVNLRTCWRLTRTEPCCTTFTNIKKRWNTWP